MFNPFAVFMLEATFEETSPAILALLSIKVEKVFPTCSAVSFATCSAASFPPILAASLAAIFTQEDKNDFYLFQSIL